MWNGSEGGNGKVKVLGEGIEREHKSCVRGLSMVRFGN